MRPLIKVKTRHRLLILLALFFAGFAGLPSRADENIASNDKSGEVNFALTGYSSRALTSETDAVVPSVMTMEDAVRWALTHSHDLERLRMDVKTAEARVVEAELLYYPILTAGAKASSAGPESRFEIPIGDKPISITVVDTTPVFSGYLNLTQPVYTFGSIPLAVKGANLALDSARLQLDRAEQKLRNDIETSFLQVALTSALVDIATQSVGTATERQRIARAKFDTGTVAKFEVLRSDVSLATTRDQLVKAKTASQLALSALAQKMGLNPGTVFEIEAPDIESITPEQPSMGLKEAQDAAVANRSDLLALAKSIELAGVGIDVAANRPMLGFHGSYLLADHASGFQQKENWSLELNLSCNLIDSGRSHAAVREAETRRDSMQARYDDTRNLVALDVENSWRSVNDALDRIIVASATLDSAKEALRIAKVGYEEGVIPYIDYQDADLGLNQAQTMYLQAVYGYLIAGSNLRASG